VADRLPSNWPRDMAVLREVVAALQEPTDPGATLYLDHTSFTDNVLTQGELEVALRNLERGGYLEVEWGYGSFSITEITEKALRASGIWPDEEQVADQLLWVLEQKVQLASNSDERSRAVKVRDAFASVGRDFTVEVAAAMATRMAGL